MQFLWKYVDEMVGKGLEWQVIAKLMFYTSATFLPMALPLGVLLSSLMLFGNMGERYELVALKSAGIPISRLMMPFWFLTLLIAFISFWFSNKLLPVANLKTAMLMYEVRMQKPALNIEQGVFYKEINDYVIRIGEKDADNQTVHNIIIYDHSKHKGNVTITYAESGSMKMSEDKRFLIFQMYNGFNWDEQQKTSNQKNAFPLSYMTFSKQYKKFYLSAFDKQSYGEEFFKNNYQMLNVSQLTYRIDSMKKQQQIATALDYCCWNVLPCMKIYLDDTTTHKSNSKLEYNVKKASPEWQKEVYAQAVQISRTFVTNINFQQQDRKYAQTQLASHQIEFHRKFTLAVACILFFFIGAPIGSIIRKGGLAVPLVITVLFFTLYFALSIIGEKVSKVGDVPPFIGMWFSTFIVLILAAYLTYKITLDSPLVSSEFWSKFFKKLSFKKWRKQINDNEA